jgi:outer membrane protein TolC
MALRKNSITKPGKSLLFSILAGITVTVSVSMQAKALSAGREVEINPVTLRKLLVLNNNSVLTALNAVTQAKAQVNIARGNLLPGISLGGGIGGLATGSPTFALTSVSFLLPFLLPSNWFALSANEYQLAASGYAYNLVELNEYASALAIYYMIISDMDRLRYYKDQVIALKTLRDLVEAKTRLGTATAIDLAQAQGALETYKTHVARLQELISQETATVRRMLEIPLGYKVVFNRSHPRPSSAEGLSPQKILDRVFPVSNESYQVRSLLAASREATWTKVFSFLGGASLSMQTSTSVPMAWQMLGGSAQASIGFGYFPTIELSQLNTKALMLYEKRLRSLMASNIESTINSIKSTRIQVESGALAVNAYQSAYNGLVQSYQLGQVDLLHVLMALQDITSSSVSLASARMDLDNQRVNLYRVLVADQFALLPMCRLSGSETSGRAGIFSWFTDLFSIGGSTTEFTVDQLCRRPVRRS